MRVKLNDYLSQASGMGRANRGDVNFAGKLYVQRVPLNVGGYDQGGAYWGSHSKVAGTLYAAFDAEGDVLIYMRCKDRDAAVHHAVGLFPRAKFYR